MKVTMKEKSDPEILIENYFSPSFMEFKEGDQSINEERALEWMDVQIKIK